MEFDFASVQITYTISSPEIAFTGDTMSDFIVDEANIDVLRAKILVVEVIKTSTISLMFTRILLNSL